MIGHIGVDESGKGDFFGPLVVAGCYVGPEHLAELDGVTDSKKLTDAKATSLAKNIRRYCPHYELVIMPARYNELYAEIKNLNRLLEWAHAKVIEEVFKLQPCELAISDQFADPRGLRSKLAKKGLGIELQSMVRAERDIAVAAASILARATFLERLDSLSSKFAMTLPKGATNVIGSGKSLVAKHGTDALTQVAKMHFKTSKQVLGTL
jgi:ribonuclease HIII